MHRIIWIAVATTALALALLLFVALRGTPAQQAASVPVRVEPETVELTGRILPPLDPRASIEIEETIASPPESALAEDGLGFGQVRDSNEAESMVFSLLVGRSTPEERGRISREIAATVYVWPCDWTNSEIRATVDAAVEEPDLDIERTLVHLAGWGRISRYATSDVDRARIWLNCPQDEWLALLLGLTAEEVAAERERLRLAGFESLEDLPAY